MQALLLLLPPLPPLPPAAAAAACCRCCCCCRLLPLVELPLSHTMVCHFLAAGPMRQH